MIVELSLDDHGGSPSNSTTSNNSDCPKQQQQKMSVLLVILEYPGKDNDLHHGWNLEEQTVTKKLYTKKMKLGKFIGIHSVVF